MGIFTFYAFCVHALTMRAPFLCRSNQIASIAASYYRGICGLQIANAYLPTYNSIWVGCSCRYIPINAQWALILKKCNLEKLQYYVVLLCFHHDSCCFASKANIKIFIESFFLFSTHYPGEKCHASNKVVQLFQLPTYLECFESPIPLLTYYFCCAIVGGIFRQIICRQSRGTTTVMEVKLHYFRCCGSAMVVAVKNQVQLKKLRIAKFIQKWKKKILLPQAWYYHSSMEVV